MEFRLYNGYYKKIAGLALKKIEERTTEVALSLLQRTGTPNGFPRTGPFPLPRARHPMRTYAGLRPDVETYPPPVLDSVYNLWKRSQESQYSIAHPELICIVASLPKNRLLGD